jgi:hypothetical protein
VGRQPTLDPDDLGMGHTDRSRELPATQPDGHSGNPQVITDAPEKGPRSMHAALR